MISWSPFEPFSSHGTNEGQLQSDRQRAVEQGDDCKPGGQKTATKLLVSRWSFKIFRGFSFSRHGMPIWMPNIDMLYVYRQYIFILIYLYIYILFFLIYLSFFVLIFMYIYIFWFICIYLCFLFLMRWLPWSCVLFRALMVSTMPCIFADFSNQKIRCPPLLSCFDCSVGFGGGERCYEDKLHGSTDWSWRLAMSESWAIFEKF